jgi:hypothetical protein
VQIDLEWGNHFRILIPALCREPAAILYMKQLLMIFAAVWFSAGCASSNVNSPVPRTDTGYVDLYTRMFNDLNWEVARLDERSRSYEVIFSEFKPLPEGVLRLALPPGKQRLRVTFLNCVVREPCVFEVAVTAAMLTPVQLVLTEDGVTQVESKESLPSHSIYYTDTSKIYRVSTVVNAPIPYRVKENLAYHY